ncbi:MAG: hypothetical protein U0599_11015 [Vicinamibacteria bacterium]
MNRTASRLALLAAAILLAVAPLAFSADAPKAVGTWDVVAQTPNGEMSSVLKVKMVDGAVKAEFELEGAARTVTDEKLEGDTLTLKVQYEGGVYDVTVKVNGDTAEGTWQGSGYSGTLTAKRRA